MDQLHRRGFPALDGAFRLLRAEVEGEPQTMLSDHHRHIALLFVRFIGGVDQLYAIALVERPRLVVIDVGEEGEMGLRVDRRRYGDRLAGATLPALRRASSSISAVSRRSWLSRLLGTNSGGRLTCTSRA